METKRELMVDVSKLVELSGQHGWSYYCMVALCKEAGVAFDSTKDVALPAAMSFTALCTSMRGTAMLDVVASLVDVDVMRVSGMVLLRLARDVFLPDFPAEHAARPDTVVLLDSLEGYLLRGEPAERYITTAYHYRNLYSHVFDDRDGTVYMGDLFEAMPADGLDSPLGEGCWDLVDHWLSFGRWLARKDSAYQELIDLQLEVEEMPLVDDCLESDAEARQSITRIISTRCRGFVEAALDGLDEVLEEVVGEVVETLLTAPERPAFPIATMEKLRAERAAGKKERAAALAKEIAGGVE